MRLRHVSSVVSKYTRPEVELQSQALRWLPALHIALRWLPKLDSTTRFFISRAPNMVTRLEVDLQTQALHRLPALASCIRFYFKGFP